MDTIPASTVVLTRQDIRNYGYRNLEEVLSAIPGMYAINDFAFNDVVFGVRGYWSSAAKSLVILVNGIRQLEAYGSSSLVRDIPVPVQAIEKIEVVRGPMAVMYGQGAFFGVINIITDNASKESVNLMSVSKGSRDSSRYFIRRADGGERFNYAVNASYYSSQGMDEAYSRFTDTAIPGVPPTTAGQLENEEKYFNYTAASDGWSVDFHFIDNPREQFFFGPSANSGFINRVSRAMATMGYSGDISDNLSHSIKGSYVKQMSQTRSDYPDGFFTDSSIDFYGSEDIDTEYYDWEYNLFIEPSVNMDITVGLNVLSITHVLDNANLPGFGKPYAPTSLADGDKIESTSLYTQLTYQLSDDLKLTAGFRAVQGSKFDIQYELYDPETFTLSRSLRSFDQTDVEVVTQAAAVYSINASNVLKLLYGEGFNRPSFSQLQFSREDMAPLQYEFIKTYEVNYLSALSERVSINASLFHNQLDGLLVRNDELIDNGDGTASFTNFSTNSGRINSTGLELSTYTRPSQRLKLDFSMTYQNSDDKRPNFEHINVAYSPQWLAKIKTAYHTGQTTLALSGMYVDEMQTLYITNSDGIQQYEGPSTDDYFIVSLNLRQDNILSDIFGNGVYANLHVSNLFDRNYTYPTASFNAWADKGLPGDERQILLSLGYQF